MRLLALLLLLAAPVARADIDWPSGGSGNSNAGCTVGCGIFFGLTFGLDLAIDIADLVILGSGDHLRPGWGIVQGLWGAPRPLPPPPPQLSLRLEPRGGASALLTWQL